MKSESVGGSVGEAIGAVGRGASLNVVAFGFGSLASFVTAVLVGRTLGPALAGHYFELIGLVAIACSVATCGAEPGAIRALSRLRALGEVGSLNATVVAGVVPVVAVSVAICVGLEVVAPSLANVIASGTASVGMVTAVRVIAVAVPFWAVERVVTAASRGLGSNTVTTVLDGFLQQWCRLAFSVCAAVFAPSVLAFAVTWTLPVIVVNAAAVRWLMHLAPGGGRIGRGRLDVVHEVVARLRSFWGFAWARGVAYVFQVSTLWIGVLLAGWLGSAADAGVFGSLSRIAVVGTLALRSINLVLEPSLSAALARGDKRSAQRLYHVATGWAVLVGFPLFVALAVYSEVFLRWFGGGYARGASALTVVSCVMLWNIVTGPVTSVLLMAGRSVWNLVNTASALVVCVVVGVVLIPRLGVLGAALAWACGIVVENGLPLVEVYWGLRMYPFSRATVRLLIVACVSFGGVGAVARAMGYNDFVDALVALCIAVVPYGYYVRRHGAELELRQLVGRWAKRSARGETRVASSSV